MNICLEVFEKLVKEISVARVVPRSAITSLQDDLQVIGNVWNVAGGMSAPSNIGNVIAEIARHALRACGIRTSSYNPALAQRVEQRLFESLAKPSVIFSHARRLEEELTQSIIATIEDKKYLNASPCDIFNALVPPPPPPPAPTVPAFAFVIQQPPARPDRQRDISLRITHVAVLHWQIWAKIVYLNDKYDPSWTPDQRSTRSPSPPSPFEMPHQRHKKTPFAQLEPLLTGTADQPAVSTATLGESTYNAPD
jgi:hypothetical protein